LLVVDGEGFGLSKYLKIIARGPPLLCSDFTPAVNRWQAESYFKYGEIMDIKIKRALLSVTDKSGLAEFAGGLDKMGVSLISTGGTAAMLRSAGLEVTDVSQVTGFPEMLDGRVKTLHPKVHGGILGRRDLDSHLEQMKEHGIEAIDLVCVNLYAFEKTVAQPDCSFEDAIENIDIGGPCLIRASAKNHAGVTVVTDPADYEIVLAEMRENGACVSPQTRKRLAAKAFRLTNRYDGAIADYLEKSLA
jgi:phosphoribosylaminoimidazolecarboxamide formyltransferase/IMP cyclohydrolase